MSYSHICRLTGLITLLFLSLSVKSQKGFDKYLSSIPPGKKIDTLLNLANRNLEISLDTTIHFALQAFKLAIKTNNRLAIIEASGVLADSYFYKDKLDKAINFYKISAEALKEEYGNSSLRYCSRLGDIGYCFYILGVYDVAINYYNLALEIAKTNEYQDEAYTNINNIGTVYFLWGQYDKAIEAYSQTLDFDKQQNNIINLSSSHNNIGKVYFAWGKLEQAIQQYKISLNLIEQFGDSNRMAIRFGNLGMAYYKLGNIETAYKYLLQAIEIDSRMNNKLKVAIRQNELGQIEEAIGNLKQAEQYQLDALSTFKDIGVIDFQSLTYYNLGSIYRKQGDIKKSEENYISSIKIATETGSIQNEMNACLGLSELYEFMGLFEKSLEYYKRYKSLNTAIFNRESNQQISAFEVKYETEKKEIENQLLKNENKVKSRNQLILVIIALILLAFVLLLVYYLRLRNKIHKQQKNLTKVELSKKEQEKQHLVDKVFAEKQINRLQKEKFNSELQFKNKQLVSSTLSLLNKNEVLGKLRSKVKEIKATHEEKLEISSYINQNMDLGADWKTFKLDFEAAHPGFFDRLLQTYPDMTEVFQKICAFLCIDLTSKEIADLMHVSVAAVNKNRQRLRKKLNLGAEADLNGFLKKI